jgi:hypothetical protein
LAWDSNPPDYYNIVLQSSVLHNSLKREGKGESFFFYFLFFDFSSLPSLFKSFFLVFKDEAHHKKKSSNPRGVPSPGGLREENGVTPPGWGNTGSEVNRGW